MTIQQTSATIFYLQRADSKMQMPFWLALVHVQVTYCSHELAPAVARSITGAQNKAARRTCDRAGPCHRKRNKST
jgi:hypothetical protein